MDKDDPSCDLRYLDVLSEMSDLGIKDVIDVSSQPVELLATMGCLGLGGAAGLQDYARDRLLRPLGLLDTRARIVANAVASPEDDNDDRDSDSSVAQVAKEVLEIAKEVAALKREYTFMKQEEVEGGVVKQEVDSSIVTIVKQEEVDSSIVTIVKQEEVDSSAVTVVKREVASVVAKQNDDDDKPFLSIRVPPSQKRLRVLQWLKGLPESWEKTDVSVVDGLEGELDDSSAAVGSDAASQVELLGQQSGPNGPHMPLHARAALQPQDTLFNIRISDGPVVLNLCSRHSR
jgi:hypothetical protein